MVISSNLIPGRDKFFIGLDFQLQTSIAVPGPGPFIITSRILIPRTETVAWGQLIKTYVNQPPWTIRVGEGLVGSRLAARTEVQAVEDDDSRFQTEIRGDTGQVLDQGEIALPWTWLPTIAIASGIIEGRIIQLANGQTGAQTDLARIIAAVYRTWTDA